MARFLVADAVLVPMVVHVVSVTARSLWTTSCCWLAFFFKATPLLLLATGARGRAVATSTASRAGLDCTTLAATARPAASLAPALAGTVAHSPVSAWLWVDLELECPVELVLGAFVAAAPSGLLRRLVIGGLVHVPCLHFFFDGRFEQLVDLLQTLDEFLADRRRGKPARCHRMSGYESGRFGVAVVLEARVSRRVSLLFPVGGFKFRAFLLSLSFSSL